MGTLKIIKKTAILAKPPARLATPTAFILTAIAALSWSCGFSPFSGGGGAHP